MIHNHHSKVIATGRTEAHQILISEPSRYVSNCSSPPKIQDSARDASPSASKLHKVVLDRRNLQNGQIMFILGTRFRGIVTRDSLEVSLNEIDQFVTHQELQRYENERFRIELEAQNAKKRSRTSSKFPHLFAADSKSSSSRSPERSLTSRKKACGRPKKTMSFINSSDTEPIKPKVPRGRPKKILTFSEELSIDELDQPVTSAKEQSRPISNTITVQIPSKTKIRMDAIRSNMPSAIATPTDDHRRPSPPHSYAPKQNTIKEAIQTVSKPNPDLTQSNSTLLAMSQPLIFDSKSLNRTIASDVYPSPRNQISLSTKNAVGSARTSTISSDSSVHKRYESCYASSKPDLQWFEEQTDQSLPTQNIRISEKQHAEPRTLSNPPDGRSPHTDFAMSTKDSAEDSGDEPLNQNLGPQYEDPCKEDPADGVSLLQQFQASVPPSHKLSPPKAPTPSLSQRPAPWFRQHDSLQILETPSYQNHDQEDVRTNNEEDAVSLLQQFRAPISLPSAYTRVSAPAQLLSHSHRPMPSPKKTPIQPISLKSRRNVSMTPHYPSRRSFAKTLERMDRWNKGSSRKRKRVGNEVMSERGREESMEL